MLLYLLFIIGGAASTIYGANWLIDGSSSIARRLGISDLVIGLTIVSLGTSAPELVVSVISSINGVDDLAIGNILGSNIANILLILGATAIIFPLQIRLSTKWKEIPFSFLAVIVLFFLANDVFMTPVNEGVNILSRADGVILLLFLSVFFVYTFEMSRNKTTDNEVSKNMPVWRAVLLTVVGIIGLFLGGKYLVEGAVGAAKIFGISERIIGLTIVAIGTSIPELVTSIIAALKRNADIAVGNILGSNIMNIFLILGITSVIQPLEFSLPSNIDIFVLAIATMLLFVVTLVFGANTIKRKEGILFVMLYICYLVYLIVGL
ncbi:MAG: calcium/sodium antiporter [Salinivirgaceae bacterium]|nr:calcium/sodium antiporter [Salinivirgaceae bacterium]MDD4747290.1 calcium/sodium antiporter [Salinivirgaceae bacterium]